MKKKIIEFEENDIAMVKVPTGKKHHTVLRKEDYDKLLELGVFRTWQLASNNSPKCNNRRGGSTIIARVLTNCPPGYCVTYLDGNPLNLRRENLGIRKGSGRQDARAQLHRLPPKPRKKPTFKNVIPLTELGVFGNE